MQSPICLVTAIIVTALLGGCYVPGRGYAESQFDLLLESRLPKFVDPDGHISPRGYRGRVECYSEPSSVRVIIHDPSGHKVFDQQTTSWWWHPKEPQPGHGNLPTYPNHFVVSFGGILDILEQRQPEPRLYLADDQTLWTSATPAPNQTIKPTTTAP